MYGNKRELNPLPIDFDPGALTYVLVPESGIRSRSEIAVQEGWAWRTLGVVESAEWLVQAEAYKQSSGSDYYVDYYVAVGGRYAVPNTN